MPSRAGTLSITKNLELQVSGCLGAGSKLQLLFMCIEAPLVLMICKFLQLTLSVKLHFQQKELFVRTSLFTGHRSKFANVPALSTGKLAAPAFNDGRAAVKPESQCNQLGGTA